jgi:hypothetical protein
VSAVASAKADCIRASVSDEYVWPAYAKASAWRKKRQALRAGVSNGAVAQLGERLLCKQEVTGSIPVGSTRADRL